MIEVRRLCLERHREKDPVKRKTLSVALHRARQKKRDGNKRFFGAKKRHTWERHRVCTTAKQSPDLGNG